MTFLSARVSNRVEALAVWELEEHRDLDVPALLDLARQALDRHLRLSPSADGPAVPAHAIPVQVVIGIDEDLNLHPSTVSVPIEERYGRDWADERVTDSHDRALRLVLDAIHRK